ncbi:hypothetical protein B0D71_23100 [Pseudomonas laurylsulfativorans]|uniref:Uncharacterized protein n=1 Tax=Pseudomonas laurylsulfativorans TaxID=1943631 RepID=A0A2S3VJ29_9PSED|nr:hypothetical protein [Pseudomonas laurylsulfativorans]POF39974.1 hypothetical protein B0D71_23100 [Pseudomonas laurylsulfativorans]
MKNPDSLKDRYLPLKNRYSEAPVLVIDTEADPHEILDAARQRIRAASDLLETLYCTCFKQAEASDIPKIISALYLLTQDGNDLLDIARQRLPNLTL